MCVKLNPREWNYAWLNRMLFRVKKVANYKDAYPFECVQN